MKSMGAFGVGGCVGGESKNNVFGCKHLPWMSSIATWPMLTKCWSFSMGWKMFVGSNDKVRNYVTCCS